MGNRYAAYDEYGFRHLPQHLARSGRMARLREMLFDYEWLQSKLDVTDPYALIVDIDYLPDDPDLRLVQSVIRMSANIFTREKIQLAPQLIGCLLNEKAPRITDLLRSAACYGGGRKPWLRPLKRCLPIKTGSLIASDSSHHRYTLKGFALTPDGSKIISWDVDALCAWGSDRLEFLGKGLAIAGAKGISVRAIAPLPDNKRIAYAMDNYLNSIFTWNIETDEINSFLDSPEPVSSLAASGDLIIAAGGKMLPRVWLISSGEFLGFLPYDTTPDYTHIDVPNNVIDNTHEYTLDEKQKPEPVEKPSITEIATTPDGTAIIGLVSESHKTWLCRWSLPEQKLMFTRTIKGSGILYITADSKWCIITGYKDVRVFDAYSGELHYVLQGHTKRVLGVAADDDWVYSISSDRSLKVWDLRNGQCLHTLKNARVGNLAVTPGGLLVTDQHGDHIQLWERRAFQLLDQTQADLPGPVHAVAMDGKAASFLVAARDTLPMLWSKDSLITIPLEASVHQFAISHDGQYLFFDVTNAIAIWSVLEKRIIGNLGDIGQKTAFLKATDNGSIIVANQNGAVRIWQLEKGGRQACVASGQVGINVLSISPNGQYALCLNSEDGAVLDVYDVESGNRVHQMPTHKETWFAQRGREVKEVAISEDGSRIAIAKGSWQHRGGSAVVVEELQSRVKENSENPNASVEVTSKEIARLEGETDYVAGLAFSHDGKTLLVCDMGGMLVLWNIDTHNIVRHYCSSGFRCCDISGDGKRILAGDDDGFIHFLALETHSSPDTPVEPAAFDFPLLSKVTSELDTDKPDQVEGCPTQPKNVESTPDNQEHLAQRQADRKNDVLQMNDQEKSLTKDRPNFMQAYHGIVLAEPESSFLRELEELLGTPIPTYAEGCEIDFGFRVENQHIVELHCSERNLSSIPNSICTLRSLTLLGLEDNHLHTLPESIGNLQALTSLNLHSNQISSLPESIGNLGALEELNLAINRISSLPEGIGRLSNLRYLDLSINQLSSFPEEIEGLDNLQFLDLHSNQISSLPESIGSLQALTELFLNENQLVVLPKSLWTLKALKKLRFDDNEITFVPEEVGQLQALTDLNLLGNKIASLPKKVYQALESLEKGGCSVCLSPMPYREFSNVFFPIAFSPRQPEVVWWFDLDGHLSEFNLITLQESKHIQINQPGLLLSYSVYQDSLRIMDASGTFRIYNPGNRATIHEFCFRVKPDQKLAAVKLNRSDRLALIYTKSDHSPATLVLHDPLYSRREVAKTQLGFGYFLNTPLETDNDGNLIAMEGQHPKDLVKLDRESLRVLQRYRGSAGYLITIKLIRNLLFASNAKRELLIWNYSTSELVFQSEVGLVHSIDWSPKYKIVFICAQFEMILLDLDTGRFFGWFDKLPDLDTISVSDDGELLFLGREGHEDERKDREKETPAEISRRLESLAKHVHYSKEDIPLTAIRRLRKIQIWRIPDLVQYCRSKFE
jgi:WD40 repeat protein